MKRSGYIIVAGIMLTACDGETQQAQRALCHDDHWQEVLDSRLQVEP